MVKISLIYISEDSLKTRVFTIYIFSIRWYTVVINLRKEVITLGGVDAIQQESSNVGTLESWGGVFLRDSGG